MPRPFSWILFLCFNLLVTVVRAQSSPLAKTSVDIIDVLANYPEQNLENSQQLSKLEDQAITDQCSPQTIEIPKCQGLANSLLPEEFKKRNWQTVFEIKYSPTQNFSRMSEVENRSASNILTQYREKTSQPKKELLTSADFETQVNDIVAWYKTISKDDSNIHDLRMFVLIEQFQNEEYFKNIATPKAREKFLYDRFKELTKYIPDDDFLKLLSNFAGEVEYNDERAAFKQKEGAGPGIVSPFEQITNTGSGICGDIHSMTAKLAEARGWEAFTVGYSSEDTQHVVTALVNPKDKNNLMIVNYGRYNNLDLSNNEWVSPTPQGMSGWEDIGTQLRIFKNDSTGDPNGAMKSIATIPTPLGSFMNELFKKDNQINKVMPDHQDFSIQKMTITGAKEEYKFKDDGSVLIDKDISQNYIIYEGRLDNAQVFGVAVTHDSFADVYQYDPDQEKCVKKKNKYFSFGVASSLVDLPQAQLTDVLYVYLNMKGGQILDLYQTDHFQFQGLIGYEFDGYFNLDDGYLLGADANLTLLAGVVAEFNKNGTRVKTGLNLEKSIGLKNQNLMTDLGALPNNLTFFNNAVSANVEYDQKINSNLSLSSKANGITSAVGSQIIISSNLNIKDKYMIGGSYQKSFTGSFLFPDGLKQINLMPNQELDGPRLTAGYRLVNSNLKLNATAYLGLDPNSKLLGGATVKVVIPHKKSKKAPHN